MSTQCTFIPLFSLEGLEQGGNEYLQQIYRRYTYLTLQFDINVVSTTMAIPKAPMWTTNISGKFSPTKLSFYEMP
jgi:hypothetical protein